MRANKQHHLLSFTVTVSQIEFTSIINEYHSRTWPDTLKDIYQSYNQSYFIPNNQLQLNQKRNKTVPQVTCQIFLDDKKMNFKRKGGNMTGQPPGLADGMIPEENFSVIRK